MGDRRIWGNLYYNTLIAFANDYNIRIWGDRRDISMDNRRIWGDLYYNTLIAFANDYTVFSYFILYLWVIGGIGGKRVYQSGIIFLLTLI